MKIITKFYHNSVEPTRNLGLLALKCQVPVNEYRYFSGGGGKPKG